MMKRVPESLEPASRLVVKTEVLSAVVRDIIEGAIVTTFIRCHPGIPALHCKAREKRIGEEEIQLCMWR